MNRDRLLKGTGNVLTFHLDKVELMDGLQQRGIVKIQVEVRGHPGCERPLSPLVLS